MKTRTTMIYRTATERKTLASDSGGGFTESWSSVASDIPCNAWALSTRAIVESDRPEVEHIRIILVPNGTDVTEGDRLVSVLKRNGATYFDGPLIVDGVSERPDHLRLVTRKVT